MRPGEPYSDEEIQRRRDEYRATWEAQRRTAANPKIMAMLRRKIVELDERYSPAHHRGETPRRH